MIPNHFEVWICVKDPSLSSCVSKERSFCFVYDEEEASFIPWVVSCSKLPELQFADLSARDICLKQPYSRCARKQDANEHLQLPEPEFHGEGDAGALSHTRDYMPLSQTESQDERTEQQWHVVRALASTAAHVDKSTYSNHAAEEGSSSSAMRVALDAKHRLAALRLLLDDGVISQAEFDDQRRSIIASI
jgi:hypothetical protein